MDAELVLQAFPAQALRKWRVEQAKSRQPFLSERKKIGDRALIKPRRRTLAREIASLDPSRPTRQELERVDSTLHNLQNKIAQRIDDRKELVGGADDIRLEIAVLLDAPVAGKNGEPRSHHRAVLVVNLRRQREIDEVLVELQLRPQRIMASA